MSSRKVTIKDVAREAGVSISTVSNALNNVDVLHPYTKKHILEVAEKLHYVPNLNGRNLKSQATKVIGLFITSLTGSYHGMLADSIYHSCQSYDYELNVFISDKVDNAMINILGHRVDGAIIMNKYIKEREIELLSENDIPVVFIDRKEKGKYFSSVIFDPYHEGELAGKYLLELGHTTFAYISGIKNNFDSIERLRGFQNVLKESGITLSEDYILCGEFERNAAYNSVSKFVESGKPLPEAIFASNDLSAIGTIEALLDKGIKVPEQISVIGCDDIEIAQYVRPAITTIRTSFEEQGSIAVDYLMKLIKNEETGKIKVLQGRIITRESACFRN